MELNRRLEDQALDLAGNWFPPIVVRSYSSVLGSIDAVSDVLKASGVLELDKCGLSVIKHGERFLEASTKCEHLREVATDEGDSIGQLKLLRYPKRAALGEPSRMNRWLGGWGWEVSTSI
jgi:hypothetical protein